MTTGSRLARSVARAKTLATEEADMPLDQLVLLLYLAAHAERSSEGMTVVAVLAVIAALQLGVMLILRRVFRPDDADDDDPGSGGGGPGWRRRRRPRKPPPDGPVCWPEFERQFAEHVAALGAGESVSSRPRDGRRV
jgi:hypothetical protein